MYQGEKMDTRKILEYFKNHTKDENIPYEIIAILQKFFLANSNESESLNVLQEIVEINGKKIQYEHAGDGEYHPSTNISGMYKKLYALAYANPHEEYIAQYLHEFCQELVDSNRYDYTKEPSDFFRYGFYIQHIEEVEVALLDHYYKEKKLPFNHIVDKFKQLETIINSVLEKPDDFYRMQKFWQENSEVFYKNYSDSSSLNDPSILTLSKEETQIKEHMNKAAFFMLTQTKANIAEGLLKYFLHYPEKQLQLTTGFPAYFKFSHWTNHLSLIGPHYQFEESHMDVIDKLKHKKGYGDYVKRLFAIPNDDIAIYGFMMEKILSNNTVMDRFFDSDDSDIKIFKGCTSTIDYLRHLQATKTAPIQQDFFKKLSTNLEYDILQRDLPQHSGSIVRRVKI